MSTTNTRVVLASLVVENRPWTIDELVRKLDDRIGVEDAIAELYAAGLLNRVGEGVICASRAALRADQLGL